MPRVRDDVARWAIERGIEVVPLASARSITRALPRTVEREIAATFTSRREKLQPGRSLVALRSARIVGDNGLVVLPDGSLAAESVYGRSLLEREPDYLSPIRRRVVRMPGHYFLLVERWSRSGNYYHWLHDTLSRLHGAVDHVPPETRYIVPIHLASYQRESLARVGIDLTNTVEYSGEDAWELEVLHHAPPATVGGRVPGGFDHRPEIDAWLRDTILTAYDIRASALPRRRIYISRRDARTRRVANEGDVEAVLHERGFETHVMSEMTFREQVELFSSAEIVVAPHGAGLANIHFAPRGTAVVELIDPGRLGTAYIYWLLADALEQEYWYLVGDAVPRDRQPANQNDMHVPIAKLLATLDRAHGGVA